MGISQDTSSARRALSTQPRASARRPGGTHARRRAEALGYSDEGRLRGLRPKICVGAVATCSFRLLHPSRPILDRLGQVRRPDVVGAGQVGDRARQLEHAVVGARREVQLAHGRLHQPLARAIELAVPAHLGRPHVGVGQQARALEALGLAHARGGDPLAHRAGWLALPLGGQLVVVVRAARRHEYRSGRSAGRRAASGSA